MATHYPPVSFHYAVNFELTGYSDEMDAGFQSVSGLSAEIEYQTGKEGGTDKDYHLPTKVNYTNLTLKRGMLLNSEVIRWFFNAFSSIRDGKKEVEPSDMTISLLNEQHQPLVTWKIVGALPKKWSVSDLNAEQNAMAIETMELYYDYFEII